MTRYNFFFFSLWFACQSNQIFLRICEQEILALWVKFGFSLHLSGLSLNLTKSLTPYYAQIVHKISFLEDTIDKMLLLNSDFVECLLSSAIIKELEVSKKWENEKYKMVQMKLGTRM